MNSDREKFLNLKNPPARLSSEEAAWSLGFASHDIPVLVAKGLLKPLGHPSENSSKYFAFTAIEQCRQDAKWLSRATDAIMAHWKAKNNRVKSKESFSTEPDRRSLEGQITQAYSKW